MEADDIIRHFDLLRAARPVVTQLAHEEDGEPYRVWKLDCGGAVYLLKEAKEYEAEVYRAILPKVGGSVPALYQTADIDGKAYLLMEFVEGSDLRRRSRRGLTLALDALIYMQKATWNDGALSGCAYTFEKSLKDREHRGKYLNDAGLEAAYAVFLDEYASVPRALCHDDLLPFNVLVSEDRAVLIDWEFAGILPYPASFARLIAHGEEDENAFFYMTRQTGNLRYSITTTICSRRWASQARNGAAPLSSSCSTSTANGSFSATNTARSTRDTIGNTSPLQNGRRIKSCA